ncbi:MAG: DUF4258 domain-containing protein [bacterium]
MSETSERKPVRWTAHAEKKALLREVDRAEVELTLESPDFIQPAEPPRSIYQRRFFDSVLEQEMLIRVVVEQVGNEKVIVTAYKTSKLAKYQPDQR